jgi:NADP-dependent 3-hydroxy acid dehydrogenase YdfG
VARKPISLAGKTVVITGAGSGMGRAMAQRLSGVGCPVAICDWNEDDLRDTADSLPGQVMARKLDVRERGEQMAFAADVKVWAPAPIGAVFNNAGVTVSQTAAEASPEDDEWVIDVNFWGVVHGTRAFLPILLEQDSGVVVNTSSVFGLIGWPTQSAYCASKFAVRGYTDALRQELRDTNVNAVNVHPGGIATNIVNNARFYVDDLGNKDHEVLKTDFMKVARTTSEKAAEIIIRGVERGKSRVLVGGDAYVLAGLSRTVPVRYFDLIKRLEPLIIRR